MVDTGKLQGHRVKRLREARGLSQDELGQLLGVDGRQIVRYEKPNANPNSLAIVQLATALNSSADYLLGLTDDPTTQIIDADLSAEERALILALRNRQSSEAIQAFAELSKNGK